MQKSGQLALKPGMFRELIQAYLGQTFDPHTCCGLLVTQDYIQMLRLFSQQSWTELVIMGPWIDIQMKVIRVL